MTNKIIKQLREMIYSELFDVLTENPLANPDGTLPSPKKKRELHKKGHKDPKGRGILKDKDDEENPKNETKFTKVHAAKAMKLVKDTSVDKIIPKGDILYVNYTAYKDRAKIAQALGKIYKYDNDGRSTNAPRGIIGLGGANWMSFVNEAINKSDAKYTMKMAFDNNGFGKALKHMKILRNGITLNMSSYMGPSKTLDKIVKDFNDVMGTKYKADKDSFQKGHVTSIELKEGVNESDENYRKALEKIARDRQLHMLSKKDKETLLKIAKLMKKEKEKK